MEEKELRKEEQKELGKEELEQVNGGIGPSIIIGAICLVAGHNWAWQERFGRTDLGRTYASFKCLVCGKWEYRMFSGSDKYTTVSKSEYEKMKKGAC